jgi:eukaryotic-like serine/threonine-protein kinase
MQRDDEGDLDRDATTPIGRLDPVELGDLGVATIVGTDPPAFGPEREEIEGELVKRYKLRGLLGKGGMGEVVSARDEQIGRTVAIKRLRAETPPKHAVARFMREARIQGRLAHPAIVPVFDVQYDDKGQPFFVMRQVSGLTLAEVIRRLARGDQDAAKQFSRQRLLRAFAEVCLAIEFAHTRGIVHRDLKPANIVLGDFGETYVLDWGIAHVMKSGQKRGDFADIHTFETSIMVDGMILGSPGYMSPEQIRVDPELDGRSDVYALGCILFELLALAPLHETGIAGIALALTGVDARLSVRAPDKDVPPELETIVITAVHQERAHRHQTARELGDAVVRYLDGDRDIVLRQKLAAAELAKAQAALDHGNTVTERKVAMRAAARALALDPGKGAPADLVARLMLEPPREVPPEVEAEVERVDDDALFNARKLITQAAIAYLAFVPILYVAGFRSPFFLATMTVIAGAMMLLSLVLTRDQVKLIAYTGLVGNCLMTMLFSWAATPFLIAPSLGVITAMSLATHPRVARGWFLALCVCTAVLTPLALEWADVLPQSTFVSGATLTLHTPAAAGLDQSTTMLTLVMYVISLLSMSVFLTKFLTRDRRAAQRQVQIQAWQLRQLVPQLSVSSSDRFPVATT